MVAAGEVSRNEVSRSGDVSGGTDRSASSDVTRNFRVSDDIEFFRRGGGADADFAIVGPTEGDVLGRAVDGAESAAAGAVEDGSVQRQPVEGAARAIPAETGVRVFKTEVAAAGDTVCDRSSDGERGGNQALPRADRGIGSIERAIAVIDHDFQITVGAAEDVEQRGFGIFRRAAVGSGDALAEDHAEVAVSQGDRLLFRPQPVAAGASIEQAE